MIKNWCIDMTLKRSQPNMQAREVSTKLDRGSLEDIEKDPHSLRMITVRHPFYRSHQKIEKI